ncbi:MAG: hypothetical protein ACRDN0_07545 [Trebonia sp.]
MRSDGNTSGDGNVDRVIRLYHRRRGWAWAGFGSLIGLVVYLVIGVALFGNLTGAAEVASIIPLFVLLALAVVGIIATIVETVLLHRFDKVARDTAREQVVHHPVYAHAHRFPPKHVPTWAMGILMLVAMAAVMVPLLPQEVNGAAYLAGAERVVAFHPLDYVQLCGRSGCSTGTAGFLSGSGADVTLGRQVPLDATVSVRQPLWDWGTGHNIIGSTGGAVAMLAVGLFFNAFGVLLLLGLVLMVRIMRFTARAKREVASGTGSGTPQHYAPGKRSPAKPRHQEWGPMPPANSDIGVNRPD